MTGTPLIRRVAYMLAILVFGIPALPFALIGAALNVEGEYGNAGYFGHAAIGLLIAGMILGCPFWLLASAAKWVVTGKGLSA